MSSPRRPGRERGTGGCVSGVPFASKRRIASVSRRSGRVMKLNAVRPASRPSSATSAIDHSVVRNTLPASTRAASRSCASPSSTT